MYGHSFANGLLAYDGQGFANGMPVKARHLSTVCLRRPIICQRFACDGQTVDNGLPATTNHLPTVCL
jgi:hypothetical protein